jgi:Na+/melibiose symporter-like transporter
MRSLANKLVLAFSAGFALNLEAWFGFEATGKNGPEQLRALEVVVICVPIAFYLVAFAVMRGYPITDQRQKRLVARLESHRARRARPLAVTPASA